MGRVREVVYRVRCRCGTYEWRRLPYTRKSVRCQQCKRALNPRQLTMISGTIKPGTRADEARERQQDREENSNAAAYGAVIDDAGEFWLNCPRCRTSIHLRDCREQCYEGDCGRCRRGVAVVETMMATTVSVFERAAPKRGGRLTEKDPKIDLYELPPGLFGGNIREQEEVIQTIRDERPRKRQRAPRH